MIKKICYVIVELSDVARSGPCKFAISASDVRGGISAKKAIRHIRERHGMRGSGRAA